ncbi:MAG TPA: CaiB/BaiF CoA-transferase family protein [Chloroflexota bacterium]|nr:CaiB/BaiF CoA-transferase family protein [Chloroflexota bacterium]
MAGALDGIVVLEVANFIAGPLAGSLLADLGAEVIKVENPEGGDPFRAWDLGGDQPTFWAYNRGKKSIALNLQTPEGKEVFRKLASTADVVLENLRPGTMDRLGLGYEQLRTLNPRLIYCAVTGFGPTGPYAQRPAYDGVGQAMGGMMSLLTEADAPRPIGPAFADNLSGMFGAYGILGALVARGRTGQGQMVGTSLVGAIVAFNVNAATTALAGEPPEGPTGRPRASQTYAWTASDGLPFVVHLSSPPKFWQGLTRAAGRPDLQEDPRFRTRADRRKHYDALHDELAAVFATQPRAYWMERLEAEEVPHSPMYNYREVFQDPHIQHMGLEVAIPREGRSTVRTVRSPVNYSDTQTPLPLPPPELGEHTDAILARLGYDVAAIAALHAAGVVRYTPAPLPSAGARE